MSNDLKYYFVEVGPNRYEVRFKADDTKFNVSDEIDRAFEANEIKKKR